MRRESKLRFGAEQSQEEEPRRRSSSRLRGICRSLSGLVCTSLSPGNLHTGQDTVDSSLLDLLIGVETASGVAEKR